MICDKRVRTGHSKIFCRIFELALEPCASNTHLTYIPKKVSKMPATPVREGDARVRLPVPIDDSWKDEFVESLLRELRRQLHQLQNTEATPHADQAGIRAQNVQTLARIERSLDRLLKIQEDRALKRDLKAAATNGDARAALERRLDQLLEAARAKDASGQSDE